MIAKLLPLAALLTALGGCGASQAQLLRRASFDMSCPEAQLMIHDIDRQSRGVTGCGRQAVYVEVCQNAERSRCTWALNADVQPAGGTSPAPQPPPSGSTVEPAIHNGIDQNRQMIVDCTNGQGADVIAAYSPDGLVSFSLAGPLAGTQAEACVRQGLGTVRLDTQGTSGAVRHTVPPGPTSSPPPPVTEPAPSSSPPTGPQDSW